MPDPNKKQDNLESVLLKKATGIGPDKYSQWFNDHPILGGILKAISPAIAPDGDAGPVDLLMAGIPFAAPLGKVFHGTPGVFDKFLAAKGKGYIPQGIHFAEDPTVAEIFADPNMWHMGFQGDRNNIIPAVLDINNAVDFSRPVPLNDITKLRESMEHLYIPNTGRRSADVTLNAARQGGISLGEIEDMLDIDKNLFKRAGFDGIRYKGAWGPLDKAWIADPVQAKTPWGVRLGDPSPQDIFAHSENSWQPLDNEQINKILKDIYYSKTSKMEAPF